MGIELMIGGSILGGILMLVGKSGIEEVYGGSIVKKVGLGVSLLVYVVSVYLWMEFIMGGEIRTEVGGVRFMIDGISIYFILLTTLLTPICILGMWNKKGSIGNMALFLILEGLVIGVFTVMDILCFYVFFEGVLIPMYLIIGRGGSRERKIRAGYYLFVYTLAGSVLMLFGIMLIYMEVGSLDYETVLNSGLEREKLLWILFFVSFMVKIPMIPVHIWLPEAHVEAPTEGSVILAGVLLKLGSYGLIRYSVGLFGMGGVYFIPLVYVLSMVGIVYSSLTAIRQTDIKRIIAYASVAHMNMTVVGLYSGVVEGYNGSILQMLSHGIVSGGLFLCVGIVYDRMHSRQVLDYSGLIRMMPVYGAVFMVLTLANIGLPGTSSFVGEFLILEGIFEANKFVGVISGSSMVLGGCYALWLFNRVMYGNIKGSILEDINKRELSMLVPLLFIVVVMGVNPSMFLDIIGS